MTAAARRSIAGRRSGRLGRIDCRCRFASQAGGRKFPFRSFKADLRGSRQRRDEILSHEARRRREAGRNAARAQALTRWRAIPRLIDQDIANLREGVKAGYTAPRGNVDAVLQQIDALIAAQPDASPFSLMAGRDSTPEFRTALVGIVLLGVVGWALVIRRIAPIDWGR